MSDATADAPKKGPGFREMIAAFNDRRMAATYLLSLAAGIPRSAILGLLIAWLSQEGVNTKTIGVFSLVTIGYAFKYLWAPIFQRARSVPFMPFGGRRSWLFLLLSAIAGMLIILAFSNPADNLALVAILCLLTSLLGPTFDLILDAWRIEVARNEQDKDLMSAMYQFGYKSGGLISGFAGLMIAAWFGWPTAFVVMGIFIALANIGVLIAPEPPQSAEPDVTRFSFQQSLPDNVAKFAVAACAACWILAVYMLANFLINQFAPEKVDAAGNVIARMSPGSFVKTQGSLIVIATIVVPAVIAAVLLFSFKGKAGETPTIVNGASRAD